MLSAVITGLTASFSASDVAEQGICRENAVPNWDRRPPAEIRASGK